MLLDMEWTAGTVSKTVIIADKTIRKVLNIWKVNAAGDEVGCSRRRYRERFHGGWMDRASSSSRLWETTLEGDGGGECSSVKLRSGGLLSLLSSIVEVEAIRVYFWILCFVTFLYVKLGSIYWIYVRDNDTISRLHLLPAPSSPLLTSP
jgi:hypothetical protein